MENIQTIVSELRKRGLSNGGSLGYHSGLMDEAADLIETQQAEIEALKDSNEHLAVLLTEAKAEAARVILEEMEKELAECDCVDRVFKTFVNLTIAEFKKKYVKE